MATVRIYKVAELLGTTSQEVVALLKRDHGIEVKGASSTIEEVVFYMDEPVDTETFSGSINARLPDGIRVTKARKEMI